MSRVDFYHLQNQTLENVLPKLLEKAYETGKKVKIKVGNEERVEFINTFLWTFNDQSFNSARFAQGRFRRNAADLAFGRRRQPERFDDAVSG